MIAVTGATGTIGRVLVRTLAEAEEEVVAISRGAAATIPAGVTHRRADLADPARLATAIDGAEALFLLFTGPQLVTGPDPAEYVETVRRAGVRRVVLLSSQAAGTRPGLESHSRSAAFEAALRGSELEWTVLRPTGFFSNTAAWRDPIRAQNAVFAPFADIALPAIDPADISAVAATALREDGHAGHTYELTGPAALSPREQVRTLAEGLDRPLRLVELTRDQARENLVRFMPPAVADGTLDILGTPTAAEQFVRGDVAEVLGRPAGTYAEWVGRNVELFR